MAVIDVRVNCYSCQRNVSKRNTRLFNLYGQGNVFECFDCYKGGKGGIAHILTETKNGERQELFCNNCRYKFKSKKLVCPYCGDSEHLVESNVTAVDLLR